MIQKLKKKDAKKVNVSETIKSIREKFGDDSIMKLDQKPNVDVDKISTGSFGLDRALGIGGIPRGRIVEIYGPASSGKTTLALHIVAEAQKLGGVCSYIDAENAMDPEYAKKLGVKTEDLFISQPQSAEQALEMTETMLRSQSFDVIVIDSVAALTPQDEIEGVMGQPQMGKQARLMSQAMRKLNSAVNAKTVMVFINQVRTSIGAFPGAPTQYTPGGMALSYYASVRLDIRRIAQIKKGEEVMGGRVRVKVVKNKVAAPYKQTEFDLMYGEGISKEGELLAMGEKTGIIQKDGNTYTYGVNKLGRGYDSSRIFLKENKDIAERIHADIITKIEIAAPVEPVQQESTEEPVEANS